MAKTGPKPIDITGNRYGRLVALRYEGGEKWRFSCDCGRETVTKSADVKRGKTLSCGCILEEIKKTGDMRRTHGGCGSPEYNSYASMMTRCFNPRHMSYNNYGAKGITVCKRWAESFEAFLEDMGPRPKGTSIDRIDPRGNYEPKNCRWATIDIQANNKIISKPITANGITQSLEAWAKLLGCSNSALSYRRKQGWSDEEIINTPIRSKSRW